MVDGTPYTSTQVFFWPVGTRHTVQFPIAVDGTGAPLGYQASGLNVARYAFGGWKDSLGLINGSSPNQTFTVAPGLTSVTGQVSATHKVYLQFNDIAMTSGACDASTGAGSNFGVVYFDGTCYSATTEIWATAGTHTLKAYPYPGWGFAGFMVDGYTYETSVLQYNLASAVNILPTFQSAKRVRFRTDPLGLNVIVDHSIINTPPNILPTGTCKPIDMQLPIPGPTGYTPLCVGDFDFMPGTKHQVAAPSPQQDTQGRSWIFSKFSSGLTQNSNYVTDSMVNVGDTVVASFVLGVRASILTNPGGLKVLVDGRDNWQNFNFVWGEGETHKLSAPAVVTDAKNRKYQFAGWSDQGDAVHDITVPVGSGGFAVTANYQLMGQYQVTTTPAGLAVTVDGAACPAPCVVDRPAGTRVQVAVASSVPIGSDSRYDFDTWSTGEPSRTLSLTAGTDLRTLNARFRASYKITIAADPPAAAAFEFTPASADGFYPEGTQVAVTAVSRGGFKFKRWDGDLSGIFSTGYLAMSAPHSLLAHFDSVPFIPPAGVKNAAAETADGSVAPGSIVAIYGDNLADRVEIGRTNPLAQTIAGVTVTVGDRLLPLLFVSSGQINAQVPSDLGDGDYTLKVVRVGQPDVLGKFTVRRNAPGVFMNPDPAGTPFALSAHEDGSPITADSPARRGETISLFGTGLGPYDRPVIDGFLIPETGVWNLTDPVSVQAGASTLTPSFAGAAPGLVGTNVVRLKLDPDSSAGPSVDLVLTVNGKASNRVTLPLEQ